MKMIDSVGAGGDLEHPRRDDLSSAEVVQVSRDLLLCHESLVLFLLKVVPPPG